MLKGEKKEKERGPQARALYLQPATSSSTVVAIVKVQTEDDESQGHHQAVSMVIPEKVAPPPILYFYFEWRSFHWCLSSCVRDHYAVFNSNPNLCRRLNCAENNLEKVLTDKKELRQMRAEVCILFDF